MTTNFKKLNPYKEINLAVIEADLKNEIKEYFEVEYKKCSDLLENSGNVNIPHLFHVLYGTSLFSSIDNKEQILAFLMSCKVDGGYISVNSSHKFYEILSRGGLKPDIYATYYAYLILLLLGERFTIDFEIESLMQESGLIYSREISSTIEERRLHSETVLSNLMALKIANLKGNLDSIKGKNIHYFKNNYSKYKYLTLVSAIMDTFEICNEEILTEIENYIVDFVRTHYDEEKKGFIEYLFEDVKRDEHRGRLQRFAHDHIESSISATYGALKIINKLGDQQLQEFFEPRKENIKAFILASQDVGSKGFGTPIIIAKLKGTFGSIVTPSETLMTLASLSILNSL